MSDNQRTNAAFTGLLWYLERRGETSAGGAAQGRGGAPEAGEGQERQRGQGGGAEGQMGQGEELSDRATEVGSDRRKCTRVKVFFFFFFPLFSKF